MSKEKVVSEIKALTGCAEFLDNKDALSEIICENDDDFMERYLSGEDFSDSFIIEKIKEAIKVAQGKEFVEKNPDAVKIFLKEYKASVEAVSNDTETVAKLCEDYKIVSPAAAAKKAIPYCNIVYQDGEDLKTNLSAYLNFLFEKAPATVGGALPNDDFYYNAK